MTHYSSRPGVVLCCHFRERGKWYQDTELDMTEFWLDLHQEAVMLATRTQDREGRRLS